MTGQHLCLLPTSGEPPTLNPGSRQNLNPTLEPDDTTRLLCQPPPLLRCRLGVQAPPIRFTPDLGSDAGERRSDPEAGVWYGGNNVKALSGNRVTDRRWYPASAVGGGGTEGSPVYQKGESRVLARQLPRHNFSRSPVCFPARMTLQSSH